MPGHPLFIAGSIVVLFGAVGFAGILFSHGGVMKSQQFRVIGELLSGKHGAGTRLMFLVSFLLIVCGACLLFSGVAAHDRSRSEACAAHCRDLGYPRHRTGPNSDRVQTDRRTWFVACICEGGSSEPIELRLDDVGRR